jgi:3-phosphoshikimate 1-carboxyvinyltransferase
MGAVVLGRNGGDLLPLAISGGMLKGIEYQLPVASAQVKSAILLAGLFAEGPTILTEPIPTRDHLERLLKTAGVTIEFSNQLVRLTPPQTGINPLELSLPGDISSAAYFIAAALLLPNSKVIIKQVGLNPRRLGFIRILQRMGGKIEITDQYQASGEPVGTIIAETSELTATEITGNTIPYLVDEIPILAVIATQAKGKTVISGAEELKVKESDRISSMAGELKRMGADITERKDGLIIKGPSRLKGATVDAQGDHRVAMSLGIAGLLAKDKTVIKGADCISESFPQFEKILKQLIK